MRPANEARRRSPTPDDRERRPRKHRSIERYVPGARRRRNTSSMSSPVEKRQKILADSSADEGRTLPPEPVSQTTSPEKHVDALKRPEEVGSDS